LSAECGVRVADEIFTVALEAHLARMAALRVPRPGALEVLDELRARGFQLALMSDCSSEVAERWEDTPFACRFEGVVLSWNEGMRKPDPRLYATAAARLGVSPQQCWYVGDGGGKEHTGAAAAGITPVLVTNARIPGAAVLRADADDYLPKLQVDDLDALLTVIGHPCWFDQ
jgi:putative hydrolase of the HAD superfamily